MSKIIRNSRVVSQTGYYKDLVSKPSINGHILEEIGNTSKNLDIFVTIPKAEYEDNAFEPNVQTLYAVIDENENVRVHFFNQNPDAPVEYILHDYREVDELPEIGDETVLYYVKKSYRDEDTDVVYRMGLWGWVCVDPEEEEYEWRSFTDTKVDDLTIHNYESLSTQIGGYIKESFETEDVNIVNNIKPLDVETDGTNTTLHLDWSDYEPYTPNTKYSFKVRYQVGSEPPIIKEGEITPHGTLPTLHVQDIGTVVLQKPEITMVVDGTIFTTTDVENYRVTITWAKPKDTFVSRINPLFIPHDNTIKVNEEGKLSVGGNSNAYAAINKVGDYLYDTYYSGLDYGYAEQYFKNKNSTAGFCSLMRSGNLIGRNYDMVYSELCDFIVHTPNRTGRFATVGVASGLKELTRETVESGKNSDDYKILPFQLVDGMNEKGVFAAYNMVPTDKALTTLTVPDVMEKKVMCALQLVRFVVDNFETALEAVEYIRDYIGVYMTDEMQDKGYEVHLMVMDKDDSYIVEFIDNKNIVQNVAAGTYMTNFYQTDAIVNFDRTVYTPEDVPTHLPSADNNITEHGSGLERYNIMARAFNPITPFTTKAEMWNLMDQLKYTNTYTGLTGSDPWGSEFVGIDSITVDTPIADIQASAGVQAVIDKFNNRSRDPEDPNYGTWHTMHSCVYDVVNTSISVASQEGSEEYTYELPKTSEEDNEIRLSEISDETIDTSQNATLQLILDGIFNENKTFIINYNDEEKILTNSTPMRDDHGVYLPFSGSPHGDYTLLRVYYDVPTKLVMGCKRYQMLPVMYSLMDIAEGSPLATNCIVAVCDDFRKITFSAPNPFKIGLKDGWKGDGTVQYSFNKQDWFDWDGVTPIVAEQNVYDVYEVHFRGVDNTYLWQDDENYTAFCIDSTMNDVRVKGNVVYMLDYETDVPDTLDHIFQGLFSGGGIEEGTESGLYDATDLTLPFTSLGDYSYKYMFENCVNLINGPQIPAIEAKVESCMGMFKGCKSLEECPTLPATVLGNGCYAEMFMGCETIVEAPTLAAQILKEECYKDMFNGCIALEECPALPAVMFAIPKGAYKGMFQGCVAITAMPALEATMLEESAYESMFNGCTALVDTPNKLPAMAMAKYCYKNMFTNCDSLVKMPQLPAKTMQPYCYQEMFSECDNLEKLSELPIDITAEGCCQQMFLNCPKITKPLDLPAKVLAKYCYRGMFQNCSGICWFASGKVYKVPSIGKATSSQVSAGWNIDMFRGTTVYCEEEEAPIPITVNNYYYSVPDEYLVLSSFTGKTTTDLKNTLPAGDKTGNLICSVDGGETWKPFVGGDTVTSSYTSPEHPTCSIYLCGRITEVKETYGLQSTDLLEVSGDIKCMSSISPEIWEVSQPDVNYAGLFNEMENLYEAKDLILVPEYTSDYIYQNLFRNTYILHGPIIPETTNVAAHAYEGMFENCKYLEQTPVMTFPEVDIHEYGYAHMFFNCLRLPKVPADVFPGIIAPEYSAHAYDQMFYGCTKIKYSADFTDDFRTAPYCCSGMYRESGVETIADNIWNVDVIEAHAYEHMYAETKIADFPTDIALNIVKDYGCQYMFYRNQLWTCDSVEDSIEVTPESLGVGAFKGMFESNTKIKACPIIFSKDVDNIPDYCCAYMYRNCTSLKYLPKLYATKLGSWCYMSMFDLCSGIAWSPFGSKWRVPCEANATQVGINSVVDMVAGTTSLSEDYGIPGSETTPPAPGTPQIFTYYYYGEPSEWVTFTSDKNFTTHLTKQYVYFDETIEQWSFSTSDRDVASYLVDGIYTLKVAGFHTTVTDDKNDNPITMEGDGFVKAKGKLAALMGREVTDGSYIFMGNTILKDITELDLVTPLDSNAINAQTVGYDLRSLFQGCSALSEVPSKFPFTKLVLRSCSNMFRDCTSLASAYDFSDAGSVTLAESCFDGMYCGCSNITEAPKLPWTTAAKHCYAWMFQNCTSLTTVKGIALTKAYYGCCYGMFSGCTELETVDAKLIKITSLGSSSGYEFYKMFQGCAKFTTTLDLSSIPSSTTLSAGIFAYMFANTAITTPPYLPWKNLGNYCYRDMFRECTEMTSYPTGSSSDTDAKHYLPATTMKPYCYYSMFYGCSSLGNPWVNYIGGDAGNPTKSGYAKRGLTTTNAEYCLGYMFSKTGITTLPRIDVFTYKTTYDDRKKEYPKGFLYYTFADCESLASTGNLKTSGYAENETTYCYFRYVGPSMLQGTFSGCTSLSSRYLILSYIDYIDDHGCASMYANCENLVMHNGYLELISVRTFGKYACAWMYSGCSKITMPYCWSGGNGQYSITVNDYAFKGMYENANIQFCDMGGKYYVSTSGCTFKTGCFDNMFDGFKSISGGTYNKPDNNGTIKTGVIYYFADSPYLLTYNRTGSDNTAATMNLPSGVTLYYSTDAGQTWTRNTSSKTLSIAKNTSIQFHSRGWNGQLQIYYKNNSTKASSTFTGDLRGPLCALALDHVYNVTSSSMDVFCQKFYKCTGITNIQYLELPSISSRTNNVEFWGYGGMLSGGNVGYYQMFYQDISLTTGPEKISHNYQAAYAWATNRSHGVFQETFYGCTAMTKCAFYTLNIYMINQTSYSGYHMFYKTFYNCNALTTMKELTSLTIYPNYYPDSIFYQTFYNCYALTTNIISKVVIGAGSKLPYQGFYQTFYNCYVLEKYIQLTAAVTPLTEGEQTFQETYYGANIPSDLSNAKINLYGGSLTSDMASTMQYMYFRMCYGVKSSTGAVKDIQITMNGALGGSVTFADAFSTARTSSYTPASMLSSQYNFLINTNNASAAAANMFSGIYGGYHVNGSVISSRCYWVGSIPNQSALTKVLSGAFNFAYYGSWGPFYNGGTPRYKQEFNFMA